MAPEPAVGPDQPAGRSLLDRRSLGEGGGEDWRAGERGLLPADLRNFRRVAESGFGSIISGFTLMKLVP